MAHSASLSHSSGFRPKYFLSNNTSETWQFNFTVDWQSQLQVLILGLVQVREDLLDDLGEVSSSNIVVCLHEDLPQSWLSHGVVLGVELVKPVEGVPAISLVNPKQTSDLLEDEFCLVNTCLRACPACQLWGHRLWGSWTQTPAAGSSPCHFCPCTQSYNVIGQWLFLIGHCTCLRQSWDTSWWISANVYDSYSRLRECECQLYGHCRNLCEGLPSGQTAPFNKRLGWLLLSK